MCVLNVTHVQSSENTREGGQQRGMAYSIPALIKKEHTPHSSPSQTGGLLSAATAPPLTTGAELETLTACTVPSLPVKAHLTTLLAGGWSCMSPSGDHFLRQATPGEQAAEEVKTKADTLGQWFTNGPSPCTFCI